MKPILRMSLLVVGASAGMSAIAQPQSYNVVHNWWINPGPGIVVPLGVADWRDFEHAWAISPPLQVANWNPVAQPPGFQPFGRDLLRANGRVWNTGGVFVNRGFTRYVGPPWPFVAQNNVVANAGTASANANASVLVNQFVPGGPFWGSTRAWGSANARGLGESAYAFSTSQMSLTGLAVNWRRGRIRWVPLMQSVVGGSAFSQGVRRWDPMFFQIGDTSESFFDIFFEDEGGLTSASLNWENDRLVHAGSSDVTVEINMDSPVIEPVDRGHFKVRTLGGQVTESVATGRFVNTPPPPVGSSEEFDIPLPNDLEFGYDIPTTADNLDIGFAGAGEASAVPEPGTWVVFGLGLSALLKRRRG